MKHCVVARFVASLLIIAILIAAAPAGAQERDGNRNAAPDTYRIGP
jgi:hypothetical protein